MTKVCTKCNETKPLTAFSKKRWVNKDGTTRERLRAQCNQCRHATDKPLTPEQRAKHNAKAAQLRSDRLAKMTPAERTKLKQKQNAWTKAWRTNNPDTAFKMKQRYRVKHAAQIAAKKATYAATPHGRALDSARHHKYYANRSGEILARAKLQRDNLGDSYVKSLIFRHKSSTYLIPVSLVEARRLYTQIKRELKEKLA